VHVSKEIQGRQIPKTSELTLISIRHHNNIIVELAEGYFFRTKGERNFYEEKANLKPDLLREPMKLQPKTHEEELRKYVSI